MLQVTTNAAPGQAIAFEPRGITGELSIVAQRWDVPVEAVPLLVKFSEPLSESTKTAFLHYLATRWIGGKRRSLTPADIARYRGNVPQIEAILASGSPAARRYEAHCHNPPGLASQASRPRMAPFNLPG